MAMIDTVEALLAAVLPGSRLHRGLALLHEFREGRQPEWTEVLHRLSVGEKAEMPIEGDTLFAILQCYQPRPRTAGRFEAHQRYTDLQYLSHGTEAIAVCPLPELASLPPYDERGNCFFPLEGVACSLLRLGPGQVAVLFPHDAHAPCLRLEDAPAAEVRKIVIKVRDALGSHDASAIL